MSNIQLVTKGWIGNDDNDGTSREGTVGRGAEEGMRHDPSGADAD